MSLRKGFSSLLAALLLSLPCLPAFAGEGGSDAWEVGKPSAHGAGGKPPYEPPKEWIAVRYGELLERGTLTHSGRTVGAIVDQMSKSKSPYKGQNLADLQPHLEPFSFVLNDVVSAVSGSGESFADILGGYPPGSAQPAWAALLREGRYRLFYGGGKARLFIEGDKPSDLFESEFGVIRHPLIEALEKSGENSLDVEVYSFRNDYATQTVYLNPKPFTKKVSPESLKPKGTPLPIEDLHSFFSQGVVLEGAEVTGAGDFFLYGEPSPRKTISGRPLSLEDFAVVYRAVFHNGQNPPYVSLDPSEDARYAKVNFGGLLEDTGVGGTVLEADKLFKTIGTGIDPNSRQPVYGEISKLLPGFITEDERAIAYGESGSARVRYWFYPDRIRTVTDGNLAAVEECDFTAKAERMGTEVKLGRPQKEALEDLNKNADGYAAVFAPFDELRTIGRMMAIVNWLDSVNAGKSIDLDGLLAVRLSPALTERRTPKLLAATVGNSLTATKEGRLAERPRIYPLDSLADGLGPQESDDGYLAAAKKHVEAQDPAGFLSGDAAALLAARKEERKRLEEMEAELKRLFEEIEFAKTGVRLDNRTEVDRLNERIRAANEKKDGFLAAVKAYNERRPEMPKARFQTVVSISGGISMVPKDFAKPAQKPDSKLLKNIRTSKNMVRSSPDKRSAPAKPSAGQVPAGHGAGPAPHGFAPPAIPARKTAPPPARPREAEHSSSVLRAEGSKKEVVVTTPSYPSKILMDGDFTNGGTITLKKGD